MPTIDEKTPLVAQTPRDGAVLYRRVVRTNRYLLYLLLATLFLCAATLQTLLITSPKPHHKRSFEQRAYDLLEKHPLIDSHVDLPILIREIFHNKIYSDNFTKPFEEGGLFGHVDLPRLDAGRYGGAFWSGYFSCPKDIFDFSNENYYPIVRGTLEQIDLFQRLGEKYPHYFTAPSTAAAALKGFHSSDRTLISPYAIEGLHQIGNSLSTLRQYYTLGVRYATLTHNCHNIYADAAVLTYGNGTTVRAEPYWGGLSKKGRILIREMNRMGMIVDLSHVSQDVMREVLSGKHNHDAPHSDTKDDDSWTGSLAPPFFSHSSAYALCAHPRNVPDDVLHMVKERKGVVMVNIAPPFISCTSPDSSTGIPQYFPKNNTMEQVVRHITHIGNLIGYDHVGFGTDFDGIPSVPEGLDDVSKMPDLIAELLRQGISEKDVIKIAGGNVMRVWADVDAVAKRLQSEGMLPAED